MTNASLISQLDGIIFRLKANLRTLEDNTIIKMNHNGHLNYMNARNSMQDDIDRLGIIRDTILDDSSNEKAPPTSAVNYLKNLTTGQKDAIIAYLYKHDGEEFGGLSQIVTNYIGRKVTAEQLREFWTDYVFDGKI